MPHFIIHCAENVLTHRPKNEVMQQVFDVATDTGLFAKGDIKVRIQSFEDFIAGDGKDDFIHVFANIMEGRDDSQKSNLSKKIVSRLNEMFPHVPIISMNVRDFEKSSYCNKSMV